LKPRIKALLVIFCVSGYGAHLKSELGRNGRRYRQRQSALNQILAVEVSIELLTADVQKDIKVLNHFPLGYHYTLKFKGIDFQ